MEDLRKRKIDGDLPKDQKQPWPKKSNVVIPVSHGASSFQPWKPSWKKDLGIAEASNGAAKPCLQLQPTISNSCAAQDDYYMNMENFTIGHKEKTPIIKGDGAPSGVGNDGKVVRRDEIHGMDPKKHSRYMIHAHLGCVYICVCLRTVLKLISITMVNKTKNIIFYRKMFHVN